MDIISVSAIHEKVVIAIIVAAAILLLIRQFYRMAKGKGSGCSSCSKSCEMKDDATPQCDDTKNENEKA